LSRNSVFSDQLSVISYQLSVISYQLSVFSYQLSAISYQLYSRRFEKPFITKCNYLQAPTGRH